MTLDTGVIISLVALAFGASIITTFIANLFNLRSNSKNQALKYITEERARWRKFIKENAASIYSNNYVENNKTKVISEFILSLNPSNYENELDNKICELLKEIEKEEVPSQDKLSDFRYCVSILLKHDWERSKKEAKSSGETKNELIMNEFRNWLYYKNIERDK